MSLIKKGFPIGSMPKIIVLYSQTNNHMTKSQIDIGVGGRFHADQMARAFLNQDHPVRLITSYPGSRFTELPQKNLRTLLLPEIAYRGFRKLGFERLGEQSKMRLFGKYLSLFRGRGENPFCFIWSSFAVERFRKDKVSHKVLVRDSTHIVHQCAVLAEENARLGIPYAPDTICVNRELEEYELADTILVLSNFAKKTFVERGISESKIRVLPLGVNTNLFRPIFKENYKLPIKAIYFGTISVRKGIHHLLEATKGFSNSIFKLTLVGPVEKDFQPILARYNHFDYFPAMPHSRLARIAAENDLYLFPSLEDGFPNTLIQAMSSGLVPITTGHCGPAELITAGEEGFIVRAGDVQNLHDTIAQAIAKPEQLFEMRNRAMQLGALLPWARYQRAVVNLVLERSGLQVPAEPPLKSVANDTIASRSKGAEVTRP